MFKNRFYTKILILAGLIAHIGLYSSGQAPKDIETLRFHSDFESKAFYNWQSDSASLENIVSLWLGVSADVDEKDAKRVIDKIHSILTVLGEQELGRKKIKRAIKDIFIQVHDAHFKKYEEEVAFHEIFDSGKYNCVTASGLYAVVLGHFKIPYDLIETPDHVYLVVDPEGESIAIESTDPLSGVFTIDKGKYVNYLSKLKVIGEEEMRRKTTAELYAEYVGEDEAKINFRQLAGDLYYNAAYFKIQEEKFNDALHLINKSLYLAPKKAAKYLKLTVLLSQIDNVKVDYLKSFDPYFDLLEFKEIKEGALNDLSTYFQQIGEKYLITAYQPDVYNQFYHYFKSRLSPHADTDELIESTHHFYMAKSYSFQFEDEKVLLHLDSAYQLRSGDLQIQALIVQYILKDVGNLDDEPEDLISKLESNKQKYPFLKSNKMILELDLILIGYDVDQLFLDEKETKGLARLEEFKSFLGKLSSKSDRVQDVIGEVYGSISGYYIRQSDYKKGKEWLVKGMKLAPKSRTLERKMKAYEEYELMYRN